MPAMLDSCMNQFDDKTFSKIRKHILCASEIEKDNTSCIYFYGNFRRSLNNGYSEINTALN